MLRLATAVGLAATRVDAVNVLRSAIEASMGRRSWGERRNIKVEATWNMREAT